MSSPVIEIKNLQFTYNRQIVLQNINLSIDQGDFVAMIGPNGGGKTTLLKIMLGLLNPAAGSISILNRPAGKASHHIGYVPQDVPVNQNFPITVLDVVLMGKSGPENRWHRNRTRDSREALETLEKMGMSDYRDRKIGELSGGQRQRVFIARALVASPRLLLLDEPTANVDTAGQVELYSLLKELNKDMTILIVSHEWIVISTYVKSVACVNKQIHFHNHPEIDSDMMETMYPHTQKEICPVKLVAPGILKSREDKTHG